MDPVPLTEVYTATPSSKQAQESALLEDASSTRPASPAAIPLTGDFDPDPTLVPTRVAIIGGGISGLAAYWSLLGTHHLVDLFEQTNDLGPWRHSIKADVDMPQIQVQVDREFLNFFQKSSPNLLHLFQNLGIGWISTPFRFSVSKMGRNGEFFNMAFESVKAATSKKSAWRSLDTWRLYYDIWKFHYFSLDLVGDAQFRSTCRRLGLSVECTVGEYLNITGYSRIFIENYFLPMVQLLWNVESEDDLRALPVQHLISFLWNTGLLTHYPRVNIIKPDPNTSLTSRNVVPLKKGNKAVHLRTKVTSVTPFRSENRSKVRLTICGNGKVDYDYVILAVSAQEALRLLSTEATELQRDVLGAFQTTRTRAWLHWDSKFVPEEGPFAYANWAGQTTSSEDRANQFFVTYRLKAFPDEICHRNPLCITLNPPILPATKETVAKWEYERPLFNARALYAYRRLERIQNDADRHVLFCGSWAGYSLQEDGVRSAFRITTLIFGAQLPFEYQNSVLHSEPFRFLNIWDHSIRTVLRIIGGLIYIYQIICKALLLCRAIVVRGPRA